MLLIAQLDFLFNNGTNNSLFIFIVKSLYALLLVDMKGRHFACFIFALEILKCLISSKISKCYCCPLALSIVLSFLAFESDILERERGSILQSFLQVCEQFQRSLKSIASVAKKERTCAKQLLPEGLKCMTICVN